MKRLIITCYLLSVICCLFASEANDLYAAGEYAEAAALYEQEVTDKPSAIAYYNLGNAYFKQGELAQSILAYERSLRLDPTNRDTRYNLRFAESRITDNIADNRAFFLSTVMTNMRNLLRERTWVIISLLTFLLFTVCLLLFLLSGEPIIRKIGFSLAIIMLVIAIFSFCFADSLHYRDTMREEAIITQGVVNAKASPDRSGTELFTIHEGTKVCITETLGEWCNITIGNYQGWIQLQNLERI